MITLTDAAVRRVKELQEGAAKPLRIAVKTGGCSGYEYDFSFGRKEDGDKEFRFDGVVVLVDPNSMMFLKGSKVDFEDAQTRAGFKIDNPNVKSSCGCGASYQF